VKVIEKRLRINGMIRVPRVRVIGPDGSQLGILDTQEALRTAHEKYNLDLIEISPTADPPVCKIMDFGKFKYQLKKKTQDSKKNQSVIIVKEIKLRPTTDQHDFDFKLKHVDRFLEDGNKVKISIRFIGRELAHTELGKAMMDKVIETLGKKAVVEFHPKLEGKTMIMVLGSQKSKD